MNRANHLNQGETEPVVPIVWLKTLFRLLVLMTVFTYVFGCALSGAFILLGIENETAWTIALRAVLISAFISSLLVVRDQITTQRNHIFIILVIPIVVTACLATVTAILIFAWVFAFS